MCTVLNYVKHFIAFVSAVGSCISIVAFVSLVGVPAGVATSAIELKCAHELHELKGISQLSTKKKKKKCDNMLLAITKLKITSFGF